MIEIVGVKFRTTGKVYNFLANSLDLAIGDYCVVETERGYGFGRVDVGKVYLDESYFSRPLKNILRKATDQDFAIVKDNEATEVDARQFCAKRVIERGLDMQLVDVECTFDRSRLTFYFISEGRIDFRELVKDLAQKYKTRIEMRQIGVRDEAKLIGGYGVCGAPLCCTTFMRNFETVSIKMAKVQGLTLNPSKLSGICDRLKCCLTYEYDYYKQMSKYMPRRGQMVRDLDGNGPYKVREVNYLEGTVVVELNDGTKQKLHYRDLQKVK
ncbi:stage 0 sporulation protein [candidate division KSB3 bacterium]|uniref:Stage 0 sporulation protein n=1 Tax=candidate division KSB3 bacterium TaxID=2044937 RepID=A0A9D5Q763_9BACT|nr:stage 0 sporulation protein [candidate division KSB3 bacterium]MBD3326113.1 stage 0 sporulation protein [candidate division KSB3 bacterium]